MQGSMKESLDAIFYPKSVAIVGASNNRRRWGYSTMLNMLDAGYRNALYPINPKEKEIQGVRAYKSISDVPERLDLAVIVVNASTVSSVIRECIDNKVRGGIVISAGFAEIGSEGASLQEKLAKEARDGGFHFVGPNCWGIWSSDANVNTLFWELPPKGPISFVSQSGSLGEYLYNATQKRGYGINKFISCGNQASLTFNDFLEYLGDDEATRVVIGYVEDVGDGRRFLEVARKVAAKKPLLIYKAGTTEAGARAARSHTAAIAGNDEIFDAACRQAGVIRWDDFMEIFDMAEALCYQPLPKGNRVAVLSSQGGFCVTAAEACSRLGMELPEMSAEAQAELREHMREFAPPPVNPIDCIARKDNDAFIDIVEIVAKQDYIDGIVMAVHVGRFDRRMSSEDMIRRINMAEVLSAIPEKFGKPLICANEHKLKGPLYEIFKRKHIPFFDNPMDAAKSMYALVRYAELRRRGRDSNPR
ncbi:MAG: CoA-binding protein [Candidatus Abyssubacteria bacterium]|nr:CoA-binding protein [Candidatus Abyssubacteria bacterium]